MAFCAPGISSNDGSCLALNDLRQIAGAYNRNYPNTPIDNINNLTRGQLWRSIRDRLSNVCNDAEETCWIEQDFVRDHSDLQGRFKPKRPNGRYSWLGTGDIHDVMDQYEKKYPDFSFLGPVPINFSELSDSLVDGVNRLDLAKAYKQGIRKIAIVFNLSPWYFGQRDSGSHWVTLWIDLNQRVIAYFDSFGFETFGPKLTSSLKTRPAKNRTHCIPAKIQDLIQRLIAKYPGFTIKCNTFQHQRANSECGVYAMYFVKSALEGRRVDDIFRDIKRDEEMNQYRGVFFRPK